MPIDPSLAFIPNDTVRPKAPTIDNVKVQQDVGLLDAFLNPMPNEVSISNPINGPRYDPNYKPTWGEELVSAVSPVAVARHYGEADTLQKVRQIDRGAADKLEFGATGKNISDFDNFVKKTAAQAEIATTILPFFAPAKAAVAGGKSLKTMEVLGSLFTKEGAKTVIKEGGKAGAMGALYGGLYGLHTYDGDWEKAAESAAWGAALGVGGMGFMKGVQLAAKGTGEILSPLLNWGLGKAEKLGSKGKGILEETLPTKVYATIFGGEAGFQSIAKKSGVIEADISGTVRKLGTQSANDVGELEHALIMTGAADIEKYSGKHLGKMEKTKQMLKEKGLEFAKNGGDEIKMMDFAKIVMGKGKYVDPQLRAEAMQSHPLLQLISAMRKTNLEHGDKLGILDRTKLDADTYMPRQTPLKEYKPKVLDKIDTLSNFRERDAALAKHYGTEVDSAMEFAVQDGIYKTKDEAWNEYNSFLKLKNGLETNTKTNEFLQGLVKRGDFDSVEGAMQALKKDWKNEQKLGLTNRSSSLDFNREVNLPWYDPNVARVFTRYGAESIERFNKAKVFGAADEKLYAIINKVKKQDLPMGQADNLAKDLESLMRAQFKTNPQSADVNKFVSMLKSSQLLKLTFSSLQNLTQTANDVLASDLGSTFKGLTHAFEDENLLKLIKSGATSESFMRQAFEWNAGNSKFAEKFLKTVGFTRSEIINRAIASNTSDHWIEKNFARLAKDYGITRRAETKASLATEKGLIEAADAGFDGDALQRILKEKPGSYWALKELGVDVEKTIKDGFISAEDKARAAYNFVEKTQFTGNQLDLPYLASHPVGQVIMQFKTFAYQQSKLAMKSLVDPVVRKDAPRLLRNFALLNTMYPMSDAVIKNIRSVITQEKAPDLLDLESYMNNLFSGGNFGIMADLWNSIEQDRGPEWFIGASTNDILEYAAGIQKTASLDSKTRDSGLNGVAKQLLKQSGVGRIPLNVTSKQPGQSTLQKLGVF